MTVGWLMERLPNHLWCTVHRELHHRDMFSTEEKSGRKSQPGVLRRCLCVPQMIAEGDIEAPYFVPYDVYGWACQHAMKVASKAADFEEWKAMRPCEPCDYWHYSDVLEDHSAPGGDAAYTLAAMAEMRREAEARDFAHLSANRPLQRLEFHSG